MENQVSLLTGRRILTADAHEGIGLFLEELFAPRGATVQRAMTGGAARGAFVNGAFDLVVMDIALPDDDGLELLREMRRADDDCVLVVLTGAGGGRTVTQAMRAGADAYVEKQHLTGGGENEHLFDALAHAFEHRAGAVARRRLEVMKTDFYSMVTHDLRNPAGNVLVALTLLRSGKAGTLAVQQEQLAELAFRSASKFVGLINDYLDYAKIDAGYLRLDREESDLMAVVAAAVEQGRSQSDVKGQRITLVGLATLPAWIDAPKLEQVFDNLISNAVKYTPDGGRIEIELSAADGRARVTVRDSGIGIATDQLGKLFTKYHRVPGQGSAGVQGTGLGLLIIKEIVEAHGGEVHAESSGIAGSGTLFSVYLPLQPTALERPEPLDTPMA